MLVYTRYLSWTVVTYQLLELRNDKVSFHGVTPFYLIANYIMAMF